MPKFAPRPFEKQFLKHQNARYNAFYAKHQHLDRAKRAKKLMSEANAELLLLLLLPLLFQGFIPVVTEKLPRESSKARFNRV